MKFSINIPEKGIVWLLPAVMVFFLQPILASPVGESVMDNCLVPEFSFEYGNDGLTVIFTDESFADLPIVSWSWLFGDGGFANNQHTSHIYSEAGCYTVRLTIEDLAGQTNYIEKEVCPPGDGQMFVEIDASTWYAAPGQEIEISANVVGGVAPYSYGWDFGGGVSNQSHTNPGPHLVTYSSAGLYYVDVTVRDALGTEVLPK